MPSLIATVELSVSSHTVRDVRELVLDLVAAWDSRVSRVDLVLLVDELSSEVTDHAPVGTALRLELGLVGSRLHVALLGGHTVHPPITTPYDALVGVLARRSGEDPGPDGPRRWFELDPDPDHDAGPHRAGPAERPVETLTRVLARGSVAAAPGAVVPAARRPRRTRVEGPSR